MLSARTEKARTSTPRVVGRHIYGNLKGCHNERALREPNFIEDMLRRAGEVGNMTILDVKSWKIGDGVSAVAIILESHISIHTWPEYKFATVDVYSCGSHTDPDKAFEYIITVLQPDEVVKGSVDRGLE